MRRCRWCPVALSLFLVTVGCASTLPPPASTYTFDRRCVSVVSEVRNPPVGLDEQRQTPNESVEKDAAVNSIPLSQSISLMSWIFCHY